MAKLSNVHYIQTSGVGFQLDGFLKATQSATIFGGVQDSTQLLECSL